MAPHQPHIAANGDGTTRQVGDIVRVGKAVRSVCVQGYSLVSAKPCQIEIKSKSFQFLQLKRQQCLVPAGVERELVIGQRIRSFLLFTPARQRPSPGLRQCGASSPPAPVHVRL